MFNKQIVFLWPFSTATLGYPEDTVEEMAFTSHGSLKVLKDTVHTVLRCWREKSRSHGKIHGKIWQNYGRTMGKKYGVSSFQCKWKFEYAHYRILSINMEAFLLPHLSSRRDRPRVDWSSKRFAVLNTATVERSGELPEVLHWTMDVGWIWNRFGCFVSSLMFFLPASTHCSHTRCFHTFCFGDVWFRPTWLCHLLAQHLGFEHVWGRIE